MSTLGPWMSNGGEKEAVKKEADRVMVLKYLIPVYKQTALKVLHQ